MTKKDIANLVLLVSAAVVISVVLVLWKKQDRAAALTELKTRFDAEVSITAEDFYIGCSSDRLVDLVEFARVARRAGSPTILDLTGAEKLQSFTGLGMLPEVKSLVAIDCPALVSAEGLESHPGLVEVVLMDSASFADASALRHLPRLETVDFSGCVSLEEVDVSALPALRNLFLSRCRRIASLDLSQNPRLRQLYLDGCSSLSEIRGLETLLDLTDLDLSNASSLRDLPGLEKLANLIVLDIRNVDLDSFDAIGTLPSLRVLRMGGQDAIETLEPFSGLTELREIHLEACPNLRSLQGMPASVSQYAGFTHCPELTSLAGIEAASGLEQLDLTGCTNLVDLSPLAELKSLVQLRLVNCRRVTDISAAAGLERLVIVMLGGSGVVPAATEGLQFANPEVILDFSVGD